MALQEKPDCTAVVELLEMYAQDSSLDPVSRERITRYTDALRGQCVSNALDESLLKEIDDFMTSLEERVDAARNQTIADLEAEHARLANAVATSQTAVNQDRETVTKLRAELENLTEAV